MATRSRTSFQKRQKEIARMEKQRDKAAKRAQRKLNPTESEESEYLLGEDGLPVLGEDGAADPHRRWFGRRTTATMPPTTISRLAWHALYRVRE